MEHFKTATLSANTLPSIELQNKANELTRKVIHALENRDQIIDEQRLDAKFGKPEANWGDNADNDFRDAVKLLTTLDFKYIRHLRLMSQCFTGFCLREMRPANEAPSVGEIPSDYDEILEGMDPTPLINSWRSTVQGVPEWAWIKPPHMLGEIGWFADDTLINYDTRVYQERMTLLYKSGILPRLRQLDRPPRILEIGGGYGALALALRHSIPNSQYVVCDLPESLVFSGLYLSLTTGDVKIYGEEGNQNISLLPNYLFETLTGHFDLVINTLSMSEMSEYQVTEYAKGIKKLIAKNGLFFEQNQDNRHLNLGCAQAVLEPLFPARKKIDIGMRLSEGAPNLWAMSADAWSEKETNDIEAPSNKSRLSRVLSFLRR